MHKSRLSASMVGRTERAGAAASSKVSSLPEATSTSLSDVLRNRLCLALGCALLAACGAAADEQPAAAASPVRLRVMAFNIEWGGTHVSFDKVVEAIRRADPDIVAVQEPEGNLELLATELEWHHDLRNHVIARHRLIDPPDADGRYVLAEVDSGQVVAIANVHLPSDPYGEYWIRDGRTAEEVVAMERRTRLPAIKPFLRALPQIATEGIPVFLAGDFNSPSPADWGPAAIRRWPNRRYSVDWPVAQAIHAAGFRDSYRERHPDPLAHPGFTWWAGRPRIPDYNPGPPDSWQSRIDFVWYAGPAEVTHSTLVGETGAPDVTVEIAPWPSDHRAVLSEFAVEPAPMPLLVATSRRLYRNGEAISIVYRNRTPTGALTIASVSAGSESGSIRRRIELTARRDTLRLDEPLPAIGRYRVTLRDSRDRPLSRNHFWVLPTDAEPVIETRTTSYAQGEPLSVTWRNAPGNRYDWIAIYREDTPDRDAFVAMKHVDARIDGEMRLQAANAVAGWPLPPGCYVAALLADDGFEILAKSAPFMVGAAGKDN